MNRLKTKKYPCIFETTRNGKPYRYIVKLTVHHERKYIGCFKTEDEAISAYLQYIKANGLMDIYGKLNNGN